KILDEKPDAILDVAEMKSIVQAALESTQQFLNEHPGYVKLNDIMFVSGFASYEPKAHETTFGQFAVFVDNKNKVSIVPASLGLFTYSPDKPFDVPVLGVTEYVENTVLKQDQKGLNRLRPFLKVKDKSTAKKPLSTVSQKEAVDAAVNLIS